MATTDVSSCSNGSLFVCVCAHALLKVCACVRVYGGVSGSYSYLCAYCSKLRSAHSKKHLSNHMVDHSITLLFWDFFPRLWHHAISPLIWKKNLQKLYRFWHTFQPTFRYGADGIYLLKKWRAWLLSSRITRKEVDVMREIRRKIIS